MNHWGQLLPHLSTSRQYRKKCGLEHTGTLCQTAFVKKQWCWPNISQPIWQSQGTGCYCHAKANPPHVTVVATLATCSRHVSRGRKEELEHPQNKHPHMQTSQRPAPQHRWGPCRTRPKERRITTRWVIQHTWYLKWTSLTKEIVNAHWKQQPPNSELEKQRNPRAKAAMPQPNSIKTKK